MSVAAGVDMDVNATDVADTRWEERLAERFRQIQDERMRDVPLLNPALNVETVGFTDTTAGRLGVLITPWFMNLILKPQDDADPLGMGETVTRAFAAGALPFTGSDDETVGSFEICSLFSPMFDFADQASARDMASSVLQALLHPEPEKPVLEREVDRRAFLRGGFLREGSESAGR